MSWISASISSSEKVIFLRLTFSCKLGRVLSLDFTVLMGDLPYSSKYSSFNTLNLIPFQINPHYLDPHPEIDKMIKHGGETRQDRINEYLAVNQNMKVVGLREASAIWVVGDKYYLKGGKKMMVFKYGTEPLELEPNAEITKFVI